jgi:Xaa-Pro aminopeptidase
MLPDRKVIANIPRLNQYMDANGLEAIAIRSGVNFTYLTGMALPGTLARHLDLANTVRGFMLLWPRKGEPVIVLDSFAEKVALRDSWVQRIAVYHAYVESLYKRVANVLEDLGLHRSRVGFEKDGLSAAHWEEIQSALPRLQMVDCSRMMDEVRWIKTRGELIFRRRSPICWMTHYLRSSQRYVQAIRNDKYMPASSRAASDMDSAGSMASSIPVPIT